MVLRIGWEILPSVVHYLHVCVLFKKLNKAAMLLSMHQCKS
jgi:hypothetical protein